VNEAARPSFATRALRALKVFVGLGLFAWLVSTVDFAELAAIARRGEPSLLALGVLMSLLSLPVFQAWRLHVLIKPYTETWRSTLHVFFVGALFNNLLPSNVGGDAVRLLYLKRMRNTSWGAPLALLLLHRLSGIGVILVIAGVYASIAPQHAFEWLAGLPLALPSSTVLAAAGGALFLAGLGFFVLPRALRDKLAARARKLLTDCAGGVREVGSPAMLALIVLTVGFHLTRLLGFLYVVRYMGEDVGFGELIMVMAVTAVLALVPVTVGALGVMEGSITIMLGAYGVSAPAAVTVALINRLVLLFSAAIGAVLYAGEPREAPTSQPL
jgi:uncharacterized membrane protein YbhN (UPF0104 family)